MSEVSRKFIFKIVIFTLVVFATASVLFSTVLKPRYLSVYPYLILVIASVTTIGHLWIIRASQQNTLKFTTAFIASTTLKLMVYLFFMLIYLLIDRSQVFTFAVTFIVLYIIFTVFEVIQVLGFLKK